MVYSKLYEGYGEWESVGFIDDLVRHMPFPVERIRTDNGREFGNKFTAYLKTIGIEHIRNEPYMPQHNGKVERYNGTRKQREVAYWSKDMTFDQLQYRNRLRVSYYNSSRKHS